MREIFDEQKNFSELMSRVFEKSTSLIRPRDKTDLLKFAEALKGKSSFFIPSIFSVIKSADKDVQFKLIEILEKNPDKTRILEIFESYDHVESDVLLKLIDAVKDSGNYIYSYKLPRVISKLQPLNHDVQMSFASLIKHNMYTDQFALAFKNIGVSDEKVQMYILEQFPKVPLINVPDLAAKIEEFTVTTPLVRAKILEISKLPGVKDPEKLEEVAK